MQLFTRLKGLVEFILRCIEIIYVGLMMLAVVDRHYLLRYDG